MKSNSITFIPAHKAALFTRNQTVARNILFSLLTRLHKGCLRIHEPDQVHSFGETPEKTDLVADIHVLDPQLYVEVVFGGSIGSGESYMDGHWSSPNLTRVIQVFVRNLDALDAMDASQSIIGQRMLKVFHWFNRNTREGSRKNISAHYDLGNDFFKLFLDSNFMYSSAIYPAPDSTLETAAEYKLRRVCEKLQLTSSDHLLEIGSGWGGMAIYAARHYGCKVTTTTISREQYEAAKKRVEEAGLADKITVLFDDYRDLRGKFSKLVSIEMIEAVGHEHYDQYFRCCSELLASDGLMLLQAITISDQRYERACNSVDFIQRYIFPGGCLPSIAVISDKVRQRTNMNILALEDIGDHYAQTLRHWHEAFRAQLDKVRAQGFDERFIRMWEFYLCYCEGGFLERSIGTVQILMAKPDYRPTFFAR